ncbi:MAG: carbohydrate binding domain-containing protein [Chitinophagales bacterium]
MKKIFFLSLIISGVLISCKKDDVPLDGALITNGSFEDGNNFSTDGWLTSNTSSNTNVPAGGGQFSLKISPMTSPSEGFASYTIEGLEGTKILNLSCYINSFDNWPGSISLKKINTDNITTIIATIASDENSWLQKTLEVTATFSTGDKLIVYLSAGSTEVPVASQYVLFDLVELTAE